MNNIDGIMEVRQNGIVDNTGFSSGVRYAVRISSNGISMRNGFCRS